MIAIGFIIVNICPPVITQIAAGLLNGRNGDGRMPHRQTQWCKSRLLLSLAGSVFPCSSNLNDELLAVSRVLIYPQHMFVSYIIVIIKT